MNVIVWLSPTPKAHPPRSNPFLRSSSDAPPFPCITPSTETCVVVVNFMIAVPFSLGAPLVGGLTPATNTSAPIRHASRTSFAGLQERRLSAIRKPGLGRVRRCCWTWFRHDGVLCPTIAIERLNARNCCVLEASPMRPRRHLGRPDGDGEHLMMKPTLTPWGRGYE